MTTFKYFGCLTAILMLNVSLTAADSHITGTLRKWDTVTIDFQGPHAHVLDNDPNPSNVCEGQVFAREGEIYAVYLPVAEETGILDLSKASGTFAQRWYNPRTGEFEKSSREIESGKSVELGAPPREASEDWAVLITR